MVANNKVSIDLGRPNGNRPQSPRPLVIPRAIEIAPLVPVQKLSVAPKPSVPEPIRATRPPTTIRRPASAARSVNQYD